MEEYEYVLEDGWTWQTYSLAEEWEEPDGNWYALMVKNIDNPPGQECLSSLDNVEGLDRSEFGPFDTEEQAREAGERVWLKVADDPDLWEKWIAEASQGELRVWLYQRFGKKPE